MANVPYIKKTFGTSAGILMFPDEYQAFPQTFDATTHSTLVATVDGRKIIKAGTIFPANDATAKGVVFKDVDVTNGSATGAVLFEGAIKVAALPTAPSAAAVSALTKIKFFKADGTGLVVPTYAQPSS